LTHFIFLLRLAVTDSSSLKQRQTGLTSHLGFGTANKIDGVRLGLKSRRSVISITHPFRIVNTDHGGLLFRTQKRNCN